MGVGVALLPACCRFYTAPRRLCSRGVHDTGAAGTQRHRRTNANRLTIPSTMTNLELWLVSGKIDGVEKSIVNRVEILAISREVENIGVIEFSLSQQIDKDVS